MHACGWVMKGRASHTKGGISDRGATDSETDQEDEENRERRRRRSEDKKKECCIREQKKLKTNMKER